MNPKHLAKLKQGNASWNIWLKQNPSIKPDLSGVELAKCRLGAVDLNGADLSGARLRDTSLSGANLLQANLTGADLILADLSGAKPIDANLSGAVLLSANLAGANLTRANLSGANLSGANLKGANLSGANLSGTNFTEADLTDANVSLVHYLESVLPVDERTVVSLEVIHSRPRSHNPFRRLLERLRTSPIPYRRRVMRGNYRGIRGLSSCYGNKVFVRDAAEQDYLDTIEEQWRNPWGRLLFWCWGLTDYGRSFLSVGVFAATLIFGFGCVYSLRPAMLSFGNPSPTISMPYYCSILTFTTLGLGNIRPNNLPGELLLLAHLILGYFTLGLLVAVLSQKIARRT